MFEEIKGKKLLILGGTFASLDLVKNAKEMGVYTIVADDQDGGVAKELADESVKISTTDMDGLVALVKEKKIDGAFCGPSEFNIRNLIKLCEKAGLPCYTDMQTWDHCANKDVFKKYCIEYDVDCPREYFVDENSKEEQLDEVDYPVIVKPVDGSSSAGISVCQDKSSIREACRFARSVSKSGKIVVEKYIENGGRIFGARYLLQDGEAYPYLLIDTYVVDPVTRKCLISGVTYTPSKFSQYYLENMDASVRKMLKGMGLKNGTAFFQALPYNGKIYIHEMGYRLSGGMLFKLTDPLMGVNDMKMMIRCALGGKMCTEEDIGKLDFNARKRVGAQLMIPLSTGIITKIEGLEKAKALPCVKDFIQLHMIGETITDKMIGTLGQHFGRFTMVAETEEELDRAIEEIQGMLAIYDEAGAKMNVWPFDLARKNK